MITIAVIHVTMRMKLEGCKLVFAVFTFACSFNYNNEWFYASAFWPPTH